MQAPADFETAIALVGATLQHLKSTALCGAECKLPGDFLVPLGVHKPAADGAVVSYSTKVASIPVSDDVYVKAKLEEKADKLNAKFVCVTGQLKKRHQFQLFHMLHSCLQPTGNYFVRLLFPDDTEPLMKHIDELIICTKPNKAGLLRTGCLSIQPARACRCGSPPAAVRVPQVHVQHLALLTVQEVPISQLCHSTARCPAEVPGLN